MLADAGYLELPATTGLPRLRVGRVGALRPATMLVPVFGWLTEGFDTPDLKDAKALLDELG